MNILILIQLCLMALLSCEKEKTKIEFPVDFSFELLNSEGNVSTTFKEGENFVFKFEINNKFQDKLFFNTNFINDNFFFVKKIEYGNEIDIGKPFKNSFCSQLAGQNFFAIGINEFKIPWIPDSSFCCPPFCEIEETEPLVIGQYIAIINTNIVLENKADNEKMEKKLTYEINFKVIN